MGGFPRCCGEDCAGQCAWYPEGPDEVVLDLGAGGWTDTWGCDQCDEIAGEYTLDMGGACMAGTYTDEAICNIFGPGDIDLFIGFVHLVDGDQWYLQASVIVRTDNDAYRSEAYWESARYDYGCQPCDADFPITLTKTSESHGPSNPCEGSMPNTITLDHV